MADVPKYWFPAKRYGWGWGVPATWQGWVVLIGYVILLAAVVVMFARPGKLLEFHVSVVVLSAALILICRAKGEPPRWRWDGK